MIGHQAITQNITDGTQLFLNLLQEISIISFGEEDTLIIIATIENVVNVVRL
jgi:hypothetical protein